MFFKFQILYSIQILDFEIIDFIYNTENEDKVAYTMQWDNEICRTITIMVYLNVFTKQCLFLGDLLDFAGAQTTADRLDNLF